MIMTQLNWHVLEPNTLRAYERAAQDFQQVTGLPMDQATTDLAKHWTYSMETRGLAVNTIRQRLSALRTISGLHVDLPKRTRVEPVLLDGTQIRTVMAMVSLRADRMLLVR